MASAAAAAAGSAAAPRRACLALYLAGLASSSSSSTSSSPENADIPGPHRCFPAGGLASLPPAVLEAVDRALDCAEGSLARLGVIQDASLTRWSGLLWGSLCFWGGQVAEGEERQLGEGAVMGDLIAGGAALGKWGGLSGLCWRGRGGERGRRAGEGSQLRQ